MLGFYSTTIWWIEVGYHVKTLDTRFDRSDTSAQSTLLGLVFPDEYAPLMYRADRTLDSRTEAETSQQKDLVNVPVSEVTEAGSPTPVAQVPREGTMGALTSGNVFGCAAALRSNWESFFVSIAKGMANIPELQVKGNQHFNDNPALMWVLSQLRYLSSKPSGRFHILIELVCTPP